MRFSLALAVLLIVGCSPQLAAPGPNSSLATAVPPTPAVMEICGAQACPEPPSPYRVMIQTRPTPMAVNRPTLFMVAVADAAGTPASGVQVSLFAAHAEDIHQDVGPAPASEDTTGTYQVEMTLHERGDYTITATIEGPLGHGQHVFNVDTEL